MIYIVEIPLIEQNNFILYHIIPLPIKQSERDIYAFINPTYTYLDFIAVYSLYRIRVKCKKVNNVMICKQIDLLYQVSAIYNCKSELLKSTRLEDILKECDVRIMRIHNIVWYQLKITNSLLYSASSKWDFSCFVTIIIRDKYNCIRPDSLGFLLIVTLFWIMHCYEVKL